MKYLMDTHIFLWWILENPKLKERVKAIIRNKHNILYLSAASTWEMLIKSGAGKLSLPDSPEIFIRRQLLLNDINILDITLQHTFALAELPLIHKDPFDRILIAQAKCENCTFITDDTLIKSYDVNVAD